MPDAAGEAPAAASIKLENKFADFFSGSMIIEHMFETVKDPLIPNCPFSSK